MGNSQRGGLFIDADGTLWPDLGPGSIFSDIDFLSLRALLGDLSRYFRCAHVVVISNQTCIARGLATESLLTERINLLKEYLQRADFSFDFYYCPHHPNASVTRYRMICSCRKPSPGMFLQAANDLNIALARSYFIGDRITDIQASSSSGIRNNYLLLNQKSFIINEHGINSKEKTLIFKVLNELNINHIQRITLP